jgi:uncharacterized protein YndB with AHSA1/START domain
MNNEPQSSAFTLTWTLDAQPSEVFRAWTDADHLGWFYNDEYPIPAEPIELDLRVGGVWRQYMVVNEDTAYFTGGIYREIVRDQKLVFSWGAAGGWPELDPDRLEESPLVTVTLARAGDCTELTIQVELPPSFAAAGTAQGWFAHIETGWLDSVARLAELYRPERSISSTR